MLMQLISQKIENLSNYSQNWVLARHRQKIVTSLQGKEIAQEFGFPLVIRPSLPGGTGAAFVHTKEEFDENYLTIRNVSTTVLIDKALLG
jgi:carbamoylphosphate synthase large subunit